MNNIENYISGCGVRAVCESEHVEVPPTPEELHFLLGYLSAYHVKPVIVGSVAVFHHVSMVSPESTFRPTKDVDLHVSELPPIPPGWTVDRESIGVPSWISPSGGHVDFLIGNHEFDSDISVPVKVAVSKDSPPGFPVASVPDIFKMKLGTYRDKDMGDLVALARAKGIPSLHALSARQKDGLELVRLNLEYGEK